MKKESTKKYTRGGAPLHELLFNLKFSLFICLTDFNFYFLFTVSVIGNHFCPL